MIVAARLARAQPGATVLFVCVEVCSLSFRMSDLTKADVVATALFGDGAAAMVLRAGDEGFAQAVGWAEHTWPDTLDVMGWRIDPDGLGVIFAQAIPPFARAHLRPAVDEMLAGQDLTVGDVDRFVCHPGGMKVMEAIESPLQQLVAALHFRHPHFQLVIAKQLAHAVEGQADGEDERLADALLVVAVAAPKLFDGRKRGQSRWRTI